MKDAITSFIEKLGVGLQKFWRGLMASLGIQRSGIRGFSDEPVLLFALPAHHGDCLVLQFVGEDGKPHYIWIDGGLVKSYEQYGQYIVKRILKKGETVDLMVVTHVDGDHIGGVLAFVRDQSFDNQLVKEYWFNSSRILSEYFQTTHQSTREVRGEGDGASSRSLTQGDSLEDLLMRSGNWHQGLVKRFHLGQIGGADLIVLTPDEKELEKLNNVWESTDSSSRSLEGSDHRERIENLSRRSEQHDRSTANGSSICLLFEYGQKRILLPGDAHPTTISESIRQLGFSPEKPMQVDCMKLSHHGSKYSISYELLALIDCDRFLISTDGSRYHLPHKEALARILMQPGRDIDRHIYFIFNHAKITLKTIFTEAEMQQYNFSCSFPEEGEWGAVVEV